MSSRNALIVLGLGVGLGVGTAYAVNEVGDLHAQADRIEECIELADTQNARFDEICEGVSLSQAEAETLRDTADTTGNLGWLAFFGAFAAGLRVYEEIDDDKRQARRATHIEA